MKKFTIILMLALLVGTAGAASRGLVSHEIQVVDELGRPVTDITNLYIYAPGGTTDAVIYADRQLQNVIVIPMLTAGGSANSTLVNGRAHWWGSDGYDFSVSNSNAMGPLTNSGHILRTSSDGTLVFPSYLQSISTAAYQDAQSISMGTGVEIVINAGQVADTLSFIPTSDNYDFIIGSIDPLYTCSLYVPTDATHGLTIVTGDFTWDGGAVLLNDDFNANVGICTGTSTGDTTIGNAAGGALIFDTAATIAISADLGITVTNTTAGNDQVFTTAGNFQIVATEAASLTAFNVDVTGAVSGMTFNTTEGPIVMTAGDGIEGDVTIVAEDVWTMTSADYKMFDGAVTEVWRIDGTAGTFYHTISFTDPTANIVWTFPDGTALTVAVMASTLASNFPDENNSVTGGTSQLIFEGATGGDAFESIIQATDPTGDIIWILPDIGTGAGDNLAFVGSTFVTNYPEIIDAVWMAANQIRFEGATADAFESVITSADITGGVVTWTLADMGGADVLSVMGSTFVTNAPEIAGSVWGAQNQIRFEGAAADAFESVIQSADITVGVVTWMLPDMAAVDTLAVMGSTFVTNAPEIAGSVWGAENELVFEGATGANAFEMHIAVVDPTQDNIMTLSDDTGIFAYIPEAGTVNFNDGGAIPLTDPVVLWTSTGADAATLPDGDAGQIITIIMVAQAGGADTLTPDSVTGCGFASIAFINIGESVTLQYIDATIGWMCIGTAGVSTQPLLVQ